jgi:hypothetical protein
MYITEASKSGKSNKPEVDQDFGSLVEVGGCKPADFLFQMLFQNMGIKATYPLIC